MSEAGGGSTRSGWKQYLLACTGGVLIGALAVSLWFNFRPPGQAQTEQIVRDYVLEHGEILLEDRFRPAGFAAPLGLKDMTLADAAATSLGAPMPLLGIVRDHLRSVIATEGPDIDWAGIALAIRKSAKL